MAPYSINNPALSERINTLLSVLADSARLAGVTPPPQFQVMPGRKYARIVRVDGPRTRSVHAFIKIDDGGLYKAASWAQPAAGQRYNLLDSASFAEVLRKADHNTGYLYKGR
jgi:hypothetical protein